MNRFYPLPVQGFFELSIIFEDGTAEVVEASWKIAVEDFFCL